MIRVFTPIMLLFSLGIYDAYAQPYTKDSLQFKVYTIAYFKDSNVKDIKLDRVFCDYCSDAQLKALGQLGLRSTIRLVKESKNRLINGQKKFTIFLRVAKRKFAKIKQNDTIK